MSANKTLIWIVRVLAGSALALWLSWFGLFMQYDYTRPTAPQDAAGRSYPSFNHGHTVWLTWPEQHLLDVLQRSAGTLAVIAVPMAFWVQRRERDKRA